MPLRIMCFIAMAALAGCGSGAAPLPTVKDARQALTDGLTAWKAARPSSSLAEVTPKIDFVDFEWKAGKVLSDFTIGSDAADQGTQIFSVSLTVAGEPKAKDVKYMVLGLDPVHIYRDEDYTRAMNMEDGPAPSKTQAKTRR